MQPTIYGLVCPLTKKVRYVGYTKFSLVYRLSGHLAEAKKKSTCHRHKWLRSLMRKNLLPSIKVLEIVTVKTWQLREKYWIKKLVLNKLVNSTEGGEGLINPSVEVRNRIGKWSSVFQKQRGWKPMANRKHSEKTKLQISESLKKSEIYRRNHKIGNFKRRGIPLTVEHRRKIGLANKGQVRTPEQRATIRISNKDKLLGYRKIVRGLQTKMLPANQSLPNGWRFARPQQTANGHGGMAVAVGKAA